jgi:hypothetical protein
VRLNRLPQPIDDLAVQASDCAPRLGYKLLVQGFVEAQTHAHYVSVLFHGLPIPFWWRHRCNMPIALA